MTELTLPELVEAELASLRSTLSSGAPDDAQLVASMMNITCQLEQEQQRLDYPTPESVAVLARIYAVVDIELMRLDNPEVVDVARHLRELIRELAIKYRVFRR